MKRPKIMRLCSGVSDSFFGQGLRSLVKFLRPFKLFYRTFQFLFYRGSLLLIRQFPVLRKRTRTRLLVVGDVSSGAGPYFFLINFCGALRNYYDICLTFKSAEITRSLVRFCSEQKIRLIPRPKLADVFDLLVVEAISRLTSSSLLVVNASLFSRGVHFLATTTPTIYYSHSIWHREISKQVEWTLNAFLDRRHQIVTVSRAAFSSLKLNYFKRSSLAEFIKWIYNWVPDQGTGHVSKETRQKKVVLTLGTVATYKNPYLWLRVAKNVLRSISSDCSVEFWWGGKGPLLNALIELSKNEPRVKFMGFAKDNKSLYSKAAIYFQPSEFESFGLAVCEAMMHGLPCVVTDCGGPAELVQDEQNGYVLNESDEDSMVLKICGLIRDEEKRAEMGRISRKRYLDLFTEVHWLNGFKKIIDEVAVEV